MHHNTPTAENYWVLSAHTQEVGMGDEEFMSLSTQKASEVGLILRVIGTPLFDSC